MASRGAGLVRGAAATLFRIRAAADGSRTFVRDLSSQASSSSFAIAFDIDGVLMTGGKPIPGAIGALRQLYGDPTNPGGGSPEASKARELSKELDVPVLPHQVLLGHTPFKYLADKFKSQRVLAIGRGEPDVVLESYGFEHVISMDSYVNEFENIDGLARFKPWTHSSKKVEAYPPPDHLSEIAGVFVVSDPIEWNRDIQVICDVLRSGGKPGREGVLGQPQPPLFFSADDLDYQSTFPVPRLGMGAFRLSLESIYNRLPGAPLHCVSYGKPQLAVYKHAERVLEDVRAKMLGIPAEMGELPGHRFFKTIYMIGDNPTTDIIGAKLAGLPWFSILTRTGCYRGQPISSIYHADKVVEDVEEAVDFIIRREILS